MASCFEFRLSGEAVRVEGSSLNVTLLDSLSGQGLKIVEGSFQESVPSAIG